MSLPMTSPAARKRPLPCTAGAGLCMGAALVTLLLLSVQARMQLGAVPPTGLIGNANVRDFCDASAPGKPFDCLIATCCTARAPQGRSQSSVD